MQHYYDLSLRYVLKDVLHIVVLNVDVSLGVDKLLDHIMVTILSSNMERSEPFGERRERKNSCTNSVNQDVLGWCNQQQN